jgi:hypothetical protein
MWHRDDKERFLKILERIAVALEKLVAEDERPASIQTNFGTPTQKEQ